LTGTLAAAGPRPVWLIVAGVVVADMVHVAADLISSEIKGYGDMALQDGAFLLVGQDLLSYVIDHHGTFKVGDDWLSAVLLSDE
jgi:hypothetical protein